MWQCPIGWERNRPAVRGGDEVTTGGPDQDQRQAEHRQHTPSQSLFWGNFWYSLRPSYWPALGSRHPICLLSSAAAFPSVRAWSQPGDAVCLCWPIAPPHKSPNAGGGVAVSQPMSTAVHITWHGAQINFGDLPYLICDPNHCWGNFLLTWHAFY